MNYTREELIIAYMAREIRGEKLAIGATILSDIATRVAKLLYAPDLILIGGSYAAFDCEVWEKNYGEEWISVPSSRMYITWHETFDIIRKGRYRIWMSPAQVDKHGNSNMSVIGDWQRPNVQLVGVRGLPDNLWSTDQFYFHIRRHTAQHVVEKVDFICSLGFGADRDRLKLKTGRPQKLVSDLGVFAWDDSGKFFIESIHAGVDFDHVQSRTGFKLTEESGRKIPATSAPTPEELDCIRNVVDPHGWRQIESANAPPDLFEKYLSIGSHLRTVSVRQGV